MHWAAGILNRSARGSIALGLTVAVSGCANRATQPVAAPAAAISYDGTYTGTLRVTGASTSMNQKTSPHRPTLLGQRDGVNPSFPLPHPAAVKAAPSLRDSATPIYNASIAP